MSPQLSKMAFGDVRLISFLWNLWLLPGDTIIGVPDITSVAPIISAELVSLSGSIVTIVATAGNFTGTGQVSCSVVTINNEKATRTVYLPVVPLVS